MAAKTWGKSDGIGDREMHVTRHYTRTIFCCEPIIGSESQLSRIEPNNGRFCAESGPIELAETAIQ